MTSSENFAVDLQALIAKEVQRQMAVAGESARQDLRPWIYMADVVKQTGIKDPETIKKKWCYDPEIVNSGLVVFEGRKWKFLNPDFMEYLHNTYWWKMRKEA